MPRRQTRAFLYRLATEMAPVSRDHLLLLFWPDKPEKAARRSLTRLISSLRAALPQPDLLLASASTVALNAQLAASDTADFWRLSEDHHEAAWETAAALVKGPFLDGFSLPDHPEYDLWQSATAQRFEQRYLSILARLVEGKAQSGELDKAIGYARQYLAVDSLAEMIHRQLIMLYARAGEREAAMRQYEACVLILERELGVDPLPETRAAFAAAQSGELDVGRLKTARSPGPRWQPLPSLKLPLIGREREREAVQAALHSIDSGGVVFIGGEPGIGKSRLLQAVASEQEGLILLGQCRQATRTLPYQPLLEALRPAIGYPTFGAGVQPVWLAEMTRLLPELAGRFPNLPQFAGEPSLQAQGRQYEALAQVVLALAGKRPVLLCFDDLHWADETTLGWLQFMLPRLQGSGLRLLATYRTEEARALADLQRGARRAGYATEVRLDALSEDAIVLIVQQTSTGSPPDLAGRIRRMTGGNTFFVLETVRDLLEQGLLKNPPQPLPVPPTVLETVRQRVGRLSPLAQQLLDAAAVLHTDLTFAVLQATTGRADLEVVDGLEELVQRQLLSEVGDGFVFQHELVQTAVVQTLSSWRWRLLNRRAAEALLILSQPDLDPVAARIAAHYAAAGQVDAAIAAYQQAAAFAQRIYANAEAAHYYEQALALGAENGTEPRLRVRCHLYEGLGQVLRRQALYQRSNEAFAAMRRAAEALNDPQLLAQAWLRLGQVEDSMQRYADSLQSALGAKRVAMGQGLHEEAALAVYAEAWALFRLDRLDEALPLAQEAVARSARLDDREAMAHSQNVLGAIYKYQGQYELSEQHQQIALALYEQLGDTRRVAGMMNNLGETARLRQDIARAHDCYQQAVAIGEQIGERDWLVEFLENLGWAQAHLGDRESAAQSLRRAITVAQEAGQAQRAAELQQTLAALQTG